MGLKKGDLVIYPDFICDVTLEPVFKNKLRVEYYSVNEQMEPDWDHVELKIKKGAKAVLSVNYFGFPQNMSKWKGLTEKHSVWWIVDNAHGYGSVFDGNGAGTYGHVSITSIRKILPVISGSIAKVNDSKLAKKLVRNINKTNKSRIILCREECNRILGYIFRWFKIPYNKFRSIPYAVMTENTESFIRPYEIDRFSVFILKGIQYELDDIFSKRRKVYKAWQRITSEKGLIPIFPKIDDQINPFVYPCFARNKKEQEYWLQWGKTSDVEVYPWPNLPVDIYILGGNAKKMTERILCFPINHNIDISKIQKLKVR